jgi:hypothetical protein
VQGDVLLPTVLAGHFHEEILKRIRGPTYKTQTSVTLPGSKMSANTDSKVVDTLVPSFTPLNELSGVVDHEDTISMLSGDGVNDPNGKNVSSAASRIYACLCPAMLGAMLTSCMHFGTAICSTNVDKSSITAEVILFRSFAALWSRKKLIFGCLVLHVLMACFLGWVLGPSSDQAYNLTSFFAISTLMLYFANLQLVYYMFTTHKVFLKEHSRGLYSTFLYWLLSQTPIYILKSVSAVLFSVVAFPLLALGLDGSKSTSVISFCVMGCLCGLLFDAIQVFKASSSWRCFALFSQVTWSRSL